MAALQDRRARLLAALYAQFGEPAIWTPADGGAAISCTIRRKGEDVSFGFGQNGELLAPKDLIKVRASEVASPAEGDLVMVLDADTGAPIEVFRIVAEPRRQKAGMEWVCEPGQARTF